MTHSYHHDSGETFSPSQCRKVRMILAALPILMADSPMQRFFVELLQVGQVTKEIAHTLTASVGLILAIPITTASVASLAPMAPSRARSTYEDQKKAETEN